jgi:hypothetical protein
VGVRLQLHVLQNVPNLTAINVVDVVASFIMCVLLLASGVGLLQMRPWGCYLSYAYAALSILEKLVILGIQLFVVWPVVDRFLQNEPQARQPGWAFGAKIGFFGVSFLQSALIIYPILILVLLLLPSVREAFRKTSKRRRRDDEDDDEAEYEDRSRRGRRSSRDDEDEEEEYPRRSRGRDREDDDDRGRIRRRRDDD